MTSRLTVTLHPNPRCVTITSNDMLFNKERYSFSRNKQPVGAEKQMLDVLNECTIGISKAETCKNQLKLELTEGMFPSEIIPAVIVAVKHFASDPEYDPLIFCDDQRWKVWPTESQDGWHSFGGVKFPPGSANIGVQYLPFIETTEAI